MQEVEPAVYLISRPALDWSAIEAYLESVGGEQWLERRGPFVAETPTGQDLVEIGGRICYKSWRPGLNRNVARVRQDQGAYLANILASGHGSVLEHANYSFILQNVSRVFTHELVRHRVGTATSQESLRYVRSDQLKAWLPPELLDGPGSGRGEVLHAFEAMENSARILAELLGVDEPNTTFETKKKLTSAMRRILPQGMATDLLWTANIRTLRHCIEMRTDGAAEAEMRLVFNEIAAIMRDECPLLFGDYEVEDGAWTTPHRKV